MNLPKNKLVTSKYFLYLKQVQGICCMSTIVITLMLSQWVWQLITVLAIFYSAVSFDECPPEINPLVSGKTLDNRQTS